MKKNEISEEQKNSDFIQLYRSHIDDITRLAREQPTAYDLFMLLCKNMDGYNAIGVSMVALTELMNLSRQSISKAIKYLKENGWLCVLKSGTSNLYIVNPDVVWSSYGNQKQYCKFQATVLLSSSENNEYLKNRNAFNKFKTIDTEFIKSVQTKKEEHDKRTKEVNNDIPGQETIDDFLSCTEEELEREFEVPEEELLRAFGRKRA